MGYGFQHGQHFVNFPLSRTHEKGGQAPGRLGASPPSSAGKVFAAGRLRWAHAKVLRRKVRQRHVDASFKSTVERPSSAAEK